MARLPSKLCQSTSVGGVGPQPVSKPTALSAKSALENSIASENRNGRLARLFGNECKPNGRDARSTILKTRSKIILGAIVLPGRYADSVRGDRVTKIQ